MPIRKFNFTNRLRIGRDHVTIRVEHEGTPQYDFRATLHLDDLHLPAESEVFLEAYYQTERKRFNFGTVGQISLPIDRSLAEFASFTGINFRLLVISPGKHSRRIIGVADRLTPELDTHGKTPGPGKLSILPVETSDEIAETWRIDFKTEEPVLILNSRLNSIKQKVENDPIFRLLIFPQVIRMIAHRMIYIDHAQIEDEEGTYSNWFKFLLKHSKKGGEIPEINVEADNFDQELVEKWIDEVIDNFCGAFNLLEDAASVLNGGS